MNEKQQPLFDTGDRRILAVLFAAGEPLELERLAEGLGVDKAALRQALERLQGRLQEAGLPLELLELEESVQLSTREEYGELIRSVLSQKRSSPLSQSAMEVLAIIAYNQPVTRAFVEQIRGVDSSSAVNSLVARDLVEEAGRLELPGAPSPTAPPPIFCGVLGCRAWSSCRISRQLPRGSPTRQRNRRVGREMAAADPGAADPAPLAAGQRPDSL